MSLSRDTPKDGKMNYLRFRMAKYSLEGEFQGFEDLMTQLQLCSTTAVDGTEYRRFGVTTVNKCEYDLNNLVSSNLPEDANYFYEMFLVDGSTLIDIPILIENYENKDKSTPNAEKN